MTRRLATRLLEPAAAGVFYVPEEDLDTLGAFAQDAGLLVRRIDLFGVADKQTLLLRVAVALDFPHAWGRSWDALADGLRDLQWLPARGYALLLEAASDASARNPALVETLVSVLDLVQQGWVARGVPFWAFLGRHEDPLPEADD